MPTQVCLQLLALWTLHILIKWVDKKKKIIAQQTHHHKAYKSRVGQRSVEGSRKLNCTRLETYDLMHFSASFW